MLARQRDDLPVPLLAFAARLAEPLSHENDGADAFLRAVLERLQRGDGRHVQHGRFDMVGKVCDGGHAGMAHDLAVARVHRVDLAAVAEVAHRDDRRAAELREVRGRSHERDGFRGEELGDDRGIRLRQL